MWEQVVKCKDCPFTCNHRTENMASCTHPVVGFKWIGTFEGDFPTWCPLRDESILITLKPEEDGG